MPASRRKDLERELSEAGDPDRAKVLAWFFKTGKGQYAEGDRFLGLNVPTMRRIALRYRDLALKDLERLLASPLHEHRLAALEILVAQFENADEARRALIVEFYLQQTARINNWDLVDASAPYMLGAHLLGQPTDILDQLAGSENLWERRIAIVATFAFLKKRELRPTFRIAERLLGDRHDLIHKATGWALREAGKIDQAALVRFLRKHYARLPRTTLRYAIERFPPAQRERILQGEFS
ncbi:MAG: DNA alkylation repair protein [Acidobacteriaceae bacterium]|nr:DNA alkylation repair protein [Acidobacteriaceae bacterium]